MLCIRLQHYHNWILAQTDERLFFRSKSWRDLDRDVNGGKK